MDPHSQIETAEKFLRGDLSQEERQAFEEARRSNPAQDQLFVEHHLLLDRMEAYAERKRVKANLHDIHYTLQESGDIRPIELEVQGKLMELWTRYRRVVGVAASIAGVNG